MHEVYWLTAKVYESKSAWHCWNFIINQLIHPDKTLRQIARTLVVKKHGQPLHVPARVRDLYNL
jgi:hypothetical protein